MTKTKKFTLRRALCYIMSLLMIMSCWVFTPLAQKAEAATSGGKYYVTVYWNVSNDRSDSDNYLEITYTYQDGATGTYKIEKAANSSGSQSRQIALDGVPTAVYYKMYGSFTDISEWYFTKITVSPNSNYSSNLVTLWEGKIGCKNQHFNGASTACTLNLINGTIGAWNNGNGSNKKQDNTSSAKKGVPAATSVTVSAASASLTASATGGSNVTTTVTGTVKDQYGVNWYQDPTSWSTTNNNGNTSINTTGSAASVTLTVKPTSANVTEKTETVTAKYNSISGSAKITVTPTYKVTLKLNGGSISNSTSDKVETVTNTSTSLTTVSYTAPTPTWAGHKFNGWSTSSTATTGSTSAININYNQTLYATWTAYKATFKYKTPGLNTTDAETSTTVYAGNDGKVSAPTPGGYYDNSKHYTFTGWDKTTTDVLTSDVTYTARYSSSAHGAHQYEVITVAPTETTAGYTKHECSVCHDTYYTDEVDPTGVECEGTNLPTASVYFNVPEAIYLTPGGTSFAQVADQTLGASGITVNAPKAISGGAEIKFSYANASNVSIKAESADFSSLTLSTGTTITGTSATLTSGSVDSNKSGYIKWTATYTDTSDNLQKTATAYTYVYAPYLSAVGAGARANHGDNLAYSQSITWWQGVNGSTLAQPSGTQSTDHKYETTGCTPGQFYPSEYLRPMTTGVTTFLNQDKAVKAWVTDTAQAGYEKTINIGNYDGGIWNDSVLTLVTAPLANLYVDTSRITNLSQVPNLKVGSLIVDRQDSEKNKKYSVGYKDDGNTTYYAGALTDGGIDKGEYKNYCYTYNVGTILNTNDTAPAGTLYNAPFNYAVSGSGTTRIDLISILCNGHGAYDAGNTLFAPLDLTKTDKSALRSAVYSAQNLMAKYCANDSSSHIYSGNEWTNFLSAYENAYRGLTKLDSAVDTAALVTALNNAKTALESASKSHILVPQAATSTMTAGLKCIHCDYSTAIPVDVKKDCNGVTTTRTEPTCTAAGKIVEKCSCGYSKETAIPALGHSYEFKGFTWTGTASAVANFTCTRDASHKTTATATITNAVTTAPGCETTGVKTYTATATFEGKTYTDTKTESVEVTGHTPGEEATCTTPQTCTVCHEVIVPAKGHSYVNKYSATEFWQECSVCGDEINRQARQKDIGFDNLFSFDSFIGSTSSSNASLIDTTDRTITVTSGETSNGKPQTDGSNLASTDYGITAIGGTEYYLYYEAEQAQLDGGNGYAVIIRSYDASGNIIEVSQYPHIYSDNKNTNGVELADTNGVYQAILEAWTSQYHGLYDGSNNAVAGQKYGLGTTFTAPSNAAYFTLQFVADEGVDSVTFSNIVLTTKEKWDNVLSEDWSALQGGDFPTPENLSAKPDADYDFLGWFDAYNDIVPNGQNPAGNKVTSTVASTNITVWSAWQVHQYEEEITKEATCTEDGEKTFTCKNCDKSYTEVIPASGTHTPVTDAAVPATEDNIGLTEGSHCEVCGEVLEAQEILPPIGKGKVYEGSITNNINTSKTFITVTTAEPTDKVIMTQPSASTEATGRFGTMKLKDGKAVYTVTTMSFTDVDVFWAVFSENVKTNVKTQTVYVYEKISIIPAKTLYYEDNFSGNDKITFSSEWTTVGSASDVTAVIDAAGFDYNAQYKECTTYSAGSAKKVTVSAKPWPTATFTFAGTGFDVIGLTSADTGVFAVTITGNGKTVKKVIDTYYGYQYGRLCLDRENHKIVLGNSNELFETTADEKFEIKSGNKYFTTSPTAENGSSNTPAYGWVENASNGTPLYQVPVISIDGLDYGTYTVTVEARYTTMFGHANGSFDMYFDAVRIHNPANPESSAVTEAYTQSGEDKVSYTSIKGSIDKSDKSKAVIIDGNKIVTADEIDSFTKVSPNNELYVSGDKSIAFTVGSGFEDVAIGIRSINGKSASVSVVYGSTEKQITVNTATELYYSIGAYRGTVVIKNNSTDAIISLTNLKTKGEGTAMMLTADTAPRAQYLLNMVKSDLSVEEVGAETDKKGTVTLTLTTSKDVANIVIKDEDGNIVTPDNVTSEVNGDEIVWRVTLTENASGEYVYAVSGEYENGYTNGDETKVTVEITKIVVGDMNGDGAINTADRMILARYLAQWDGAQQADEAALDINGDGVVNTADRMILSRAIAQWDGYAQYIA